MDINGTAAIVTGGASGLGEATARKLAASGAHVTIVDINDEIGQAVAADIGRLATFARADVTDADQVNACVTEASRRTPLRVAVNCAGIAPAERTVSRDGAPHSSDVFRTALEVNLIGTFNVMTHAAAAIAGTEPQDSGERGVIVNTASIAAYEGQIGQLAYAATKGAIVAMTLPAARDLAHLGIRVCAIAPGTFETPLLAKLPESARVDLAATIPFPKRLGQPSEFAALVHSIVSIPTLNGEVIRLDGALRMQPR